MSQTIRFLVCLIFGLGSFLPRILVAEEPTKTAEQQWGHFTGQLIYDGDPPEREKLEITKKDFPETFDESLLVDAESHGLANVFVYLRTKPDSDQPLPIHPDYAETLNKPAVMHANAGGYYPHALLVRTNQMLIFDHKQAKMAINTKFDPYRNGASCALIPAEQELSMTYTHSESLPTPLGCNIHLWFSAYVLIRDNPYMAITDVNGKFEINNLPAGEHEFQFWHEKTGYLKLPAMKLREAEVAGTPKKGRTLLNIQPGDNNLGEIKIDPTQF